MAHTHQQPGITLEAIGQRIYVAGNTYPIKDQLKRAGCHWDGDGLGRRTDAMTTTTSTLDIVRQHREGR